MIFLISVAAQSTLWRFRQKLEGVYIKSGEVSIVGASVIAAKQSRPKQGKDRQNT